MSLLTVGHKGVFAGITHTLNFHGPDCSHSSNLVSNMLNMASVFLGFELKLHLVNVLIYCRTTESAFILKDFENASPRLNPLFHKP